MDFYSILDMIRELENTIETNTKHVRAKYLGLDDRAGPFLVGDDFIIPLVESSARYYGGLEYVDSAHTLPVGNYTCYFEESDRIRECLEYYSENKENEQV